MSTHQVPLSWPIRDIRDVFESEDRDFTPWLAGNLDRLGRVLGMRLDRVECEASTFYGKRIDILAEERDLDTLVVIENQLEQSDDDHLGRLLVYAAAKWARVAIWIAPSFRQEHTEAIRWINSNLRESFQVYGVVLRIDGDDTSDIRLIVESSPRFWEPKSRLTVPSEVWDADEMYRRFWQSLIAKSKSLGLPGKPRASRRRYCEFPTGFKDFKYAARFAPNQRTASVSLAIKHPDQSTRRTMFDQLSYDQKEIDDEVWERLELELYWDSSRTRVGVSIPATIADPIEDISKVRSWMASALAEFNGTITPYLTKASLAS